MLTGVDTVPAVLAVTAHRHLGRPALVGAGPAATWGELAATVRSAALGLEAGGMEPGTRVRMAVGDPVGRRALELALACVGAIRLSAPIPGGSGAGAGVVLDDEDVERLRAAGVPVDRAEPDRFERRTGSVDADAPALDDGIATWTQRQLLWAARSLGASLDATADDRVLSTLPADATGWVCGALLPLVSGAATAVAGPGPEPSVFERVRPTLLVCDDADVAGWFPGDTAAGSASRWERVRTRLAGPSRRRPPGWEPCRAALVVGGGAGAERLAALGLPGRVAVSWPGHAGLATGAAGPIGGLGRPLPGVTIAIDDDGEVLVRSGSVADGRCDDGWLHTGWGGDVDAAGRLVAVADASGPTR